MPDFLEKYNNFCLCGAILFLFIKGKSWYNRRAGGAPKPVSYTHLKRAANGFEYIAPYHESDWDKLPERKQQNRKKENRRPAVRNEVHPVTLLQRKNAIYNCVTALIIFVLLASVISGYAAISANKLSNLSMQENIDELAAQKEKLELSINTKCTVQQISQIAEQRLSLIHIYL